MIGASQRAPAANASGQPLPSSLFAHVGDRLERLIAMLGVERSAAQIREVFALLCGDSLASPRDSAPRASRLNADGTPLQFALALDARPQLQFLCEPAEPGASNAERLHTARERIDGLLTMFGLDDVAGIHAWLARVAPVDDPDLAADHAGPVWLGAGFGPSAAPRLKVYVNAKWGLARNRWTRIDSSADYVGAGIEWQALRPSLHRALEPLGMALTLRADTPPEGRVYFHGPGMTFADHEAQAAACASAAVCSRLPAFKAQLLADDAPYATRSAVCSFDLRGATVPTFKLEMCCHCAFTSDTVARARCRRWLLEGGFDATAYLRYVDVLSPGALSTQGTRLHSYVGIGERHGVACPTLYFNPTAVPWPNARASKPQ